MGEPEALTVRGRMVADVFLGLVNIIPFLGDDRWVKGEYVYLYSFIINYL